jgi:MFS family permease
MGNVHFSDVLRNRNLMLLNAATFISFFGMTMQRMLFSWWVLELTESPYLLGIVTSMSMLPMVFSIVGGLAVDRFDRRSVLMLSETLRIVSAGLIALTVLSGQFQFWLLPAVSLLSGFAFPFGFPARAAMTPDLAGKNAVVRAMSVQMMFWNSAFILGPYVGGLLLGQIGYSGCFFILVGAFILELFILMLLPRSKPRSQPQDSVLRGLIESGTYIRNHFGVLGVLVMAALWNLFITPIQSALLPIIARNVLHVDAAGLGALTGSMGVGSFIGALFLVGLRDYKRSGWIATITSALNAIFLIIISTSQNFGLSQILLILIGCMNALINTMSQTSLLVHTAEDYRGRVMGMRGQAIATMPIGSFMMGVEANIMGAPFALALNGAIYGLLIVGLAIVLPHFRRLE